MSDETDFETRWQALEKESPLKTVTCQKKVLVNFSLENVLDLYVANAKQAVKENQVNQAVYDALLTNINIFKYSLTELDHEAKLREFSAAIGSRIKKIL
jgi:hypothetical protein